jgi:hypothetical protein
MKPLGEGVVHARIKGSSDGRAVRGRPYDPAPRQTRSTVPVDWIREGRRNIQAMSGTARAGLETFIDIGCIV